MIIKINPSQHTLHTLGYTNSGKGYKKKIGKQDFPRFHLELKDGYAELHIDKKRLHGFMMKFIGKIKTNNIVNNNPQLQIEAKRIEVEEIYNNVVKIRNSINKKIYELNNLKNKL